ncbi:MAG TPA: hypothetical protein VGQ92_11625 [Actinoplanes sp.]|jgi:hypothetical protein|nr:hypothetical protein [Actinoplanes sp.]
MSEREDGPLCADCDPPAEEQQTPALAAAPAPEEEPPAFVPARVGCRTDLRGWAGAHLHGAVRPGRRTPGRGRPPGRWC